MIVTRTEYDAIQRGGMTKYSYEEVSAALADFACVQHQSYDLFVKANQLLGPNMATATDLVAMLQSGGPLAGLYEKMSSELFPTLGFGKGFQEIYPVATWKRQTEKFQRAVSRLERAYIKAEKVANKKT